MNEHMCDDTKPAIHRHHQRLSDHVNHHRGQIQYQTLRKEVLAIGEHGSLELAFLKQPEAPQQDNARFAMTTSMPHDGQGLIHDLFRAGQRVMKACYLVRKPSHRAKKRASLR